MQRKQGLIFISIGLFLMAVFSFWRFRQARILSFLNESNTNLAVQVHSGSKPVRIVIPAKNIDLEIKEAKITAGVWQIYKDAAGHLDSSASPGEGGNVVIYGHNKTAVFGPIRWLSKGDLIEIFDEQGSKFSYQVDNIVEVSPNAISYVMPKSNETLTLYTCSGLFDSKRYIIVAKPS